PHRRRPAPALFPYTTLFRSSMFSFANSTLPDVRVSSSLRIGSIALHGPHHGAQKSTTTGTSAASTSRSNVESLTSNTGGIVAGADRKSTRLNSSHVAISYAV